MSARAGALLCVEVGRGDCEVVETAAEQGDGVQAWVEQGISRLARLLPMSLPVIVIVLGTYAWAGFPAFGSFVLLVAKMSLQGYAVLFLMTIGLARFLDDADPDTVWVDTPEEGEGAEAFA